MFQKILILILVVSMSILGILFYDNEYYTTVDSTPLTKATYTAYCEQEKIEYIPYIQWTWVVNSKDTAIVYKKLHPITKWVTYDIEP